jgi:hypothetical protein
MKYLKKFNETKNNDLVEIKKKLIIIAKDNKKEDITDNIDYWDDVISDINRSKNENDILKIAQNDFGFDSLEQIK